MAERVTRLDVEEFLRSRGLRSRTHGGWVYLDCVLCGRDRALHIALGSDGKHPIGSWTCQGCGEHGGLKALKERLGEVVVRRHDRRDDLADIAAGISFAGDGGSGAALATAAWAGPATPDGAPVPGQPGGEPSTAPATTTATNNPTEWRPDLWRECRDRLWTDEAEPVRAYLLNERKLTEEALRHFELGATKTQRGAWLVAIPCRDPAGEVVQVRFRSVPGVCPTCSGAGCPSTNKACAGGRVKKGFLHCKGRPLPLFNAHRLSPPTTHASAVLVEGELDVVALWVLGFRDNVVSGTAGADNFADAWLDQLEPYERFLVAYDADGPGDDGAAKVAAKLGRYRCARVRLPRKDAGDCLKDGLAKEDVALAFLDATEMVAHRMLRPDAWATELEAMIGTPAKMTGRPTGSKKLDLCLGGWRAGLCVVTGDTSHGKSTMATWLGAQQAYAYDEPTLFCSFEDPPMVVVQRLLRMQLGSDPLKTSPGERAAAFGTLVSHPAYVLDPGGVRFTPDDIVDVLRYARRRLGVTFMVVDHIGYLIRPGDDEDERPQIEKLVRELHLTGLEDGFTVLLLVHPNRQHMTRRHPDRKGQPDRARIKDCKGASAIEQDADYGLVVERAQLDPNDKDDHPRTYVHVDKLRSLYGVVGSTATLYYDRQAARYADEWEVLPVAQRQAARSTPDPRLPQEHDADPALADAAGAGASQN